MDGSRTLPHTAALKPSPSKAVDNGNDHYDDGYSVGAATASTSPQSNTLTDTAVRTSLQSENGQPPATPQRLLVTTNGEDGDGPESAASPSPPSTPPVPPLVPVAFKISLAQFCTVCAVLVNEAIATTMLFTYVGLYIAHIEPRLNRSSAGYVSGLLVGIFQGAQFVALPRWGRLSDAIGRKPVLLTGLFLSTFCALAFGFATNLYVAMVARIVHGLVAVGGPMVKTYISEVTDEHSQAKGFGMMSVAWAIGAFVGPSVGGFLYDPCSSPFVSAVVGCGAFATYPALPPALALSIYTACVGVAALLVIPESNAHAQPVTIQRVLHALFGRQVVESDRRPLAHTDDDDDDEGNGGSDGRHAAADPRGGNSSVEMEPRNINNKTTSNGSRSSSPNAAAGTGVRRHALEEYDGEPELIAAATASDHPPLEDALGEHTANAILEKEEEAEQIREGAAVPRTQAGSNGSAAGGQQLPPRPPQEGEAPQGEREGVVSTMNTRYNAMPVLGVVDTLRHPLLGTIIPMYMLLCGYNIAFNEVVPLYAIAYSSDGGLGFTSREVGVLYMINAAVSIVANSIFSSFAHKVSHLWLWRACCVGLAVMMASAGLVSYLPNTLTVFLAFIPLSIVRTSSATWCFSLNMMFTANAAPKRHLGAVTTTSHACGALARSIGPIIATPLFAWSVSAPHWFPFNHFFVFFLCGGCALVSFTMAGKLTDDDVSRRHL